MFKLKLTSGVDAFFSRAFVLSSEQICVGVSDDQKVFVKVEIEKHPRKANDIRQETAIMKHLNAQNCLSCPHVLGEGIIAKEILLQIVDPLAKSVIENSEKDFFHYNAQECIQGVKKFRFEDVFLAMIEQQKMGVFQGDIKVENIVYDPNAGACILIDYDQSEMLSQEVQNLDSYSYFQWCDQRATEKYSYVGLYGFLAYFGVKFEEKFQHLFRNGSFNVGKTSAFLMQETTLSKGGIYHSFAFDSIFADGERSLDVRKLLLDKLEFSAGETVLDVGCNAGLLSIYLNDRGCDVVGIDLDRKIVTGARKIANILGKNISYHCLDLDKEEIVGKFDTVMLFSVIHHTQNIARNARRIARSCKRIIIECRLNEEGAKPVGDKWIKTSKWDHPNVASLEQGLKNLFPGFRVQQNLGSVDRSRFIIELVKDIQASKLN